MREKKSMEVGEYIDQYLLALKGLVHSSIYASWCHILDVDDLSPSIVAISQFDHCM